MSSSTMENTSKTSFFRKLLVPRGFRGFDRNATNWLPSDWSSLNRVDSLDVQCLNSPFNLARLLYENETRNGIRYLHEGVEKTYPTKKFISAFEKVANEVVPDELKSLKTSDVGEAGDERLFMMTYQTPEVDGVSSIVSFAVPVYRKDMDEVRKHLNSFVETTYRIYGYNLTAISELSRSPSEDISVLSIQFEAQHPNESQVKLCDTLYHVAPMRLLPKIRKQGLVPKAKSGEFKYDGRVYMFNDCPIDRVLDYGEYKADYVGDHGFCLFKIDGKRLQELDSFKSGKLGIYVDWTFNVENGVEAVFTYGNIPLCLMDDTCLVYSPASSRTPQKLNFKS